MGFPETASAGRSTPHGDGFAEWFGHSKVRTPDGIPLVLFHGSPDASFTEFRAELRGSNTGSRDAKAGFYFTDDEDFARHFTTKRAYDWITGERIVDRPSASAGVMPVYLSLQNPLDLRKLTEGVIDAILNTRAMGRFATREYIRALGKTAAGTKELQENLAHCVPELLALGYDGIISRLVHQRKVRREFIAFESTQIKSAVNNNGMFDARNPDMRFSMASTPSHASFDSESVPRVANKIQELIGEGAGARLLSQPGGVHIIHSSEIGSISELAGVNDVLKDTDPRRGFYSALARAIESATFERAPASAWEDFIRAQTLKGTKAEEVDWTGIIDWLGGQGGRISKSEVLAYAKANGLHIKVVTLDDPAASAEKATRALEGTGYAAIYDPIDREVLYVDQDDDLVDYADLPPVAKSIVDSMSSGACGPAQYAQKAMPHGRNYREILITLPHDDGYTVAEKIAEGDQVWAIVDATGQIAPGTACYALKRSALEEARLMNLEHGTGTYVSGHWSTPNVLVHLRVADHVDSESKRVLFIEEIQSDWGQGAKQTGVMGPRLSSKERKEFDEMLAFGRSRLPPEKLTRFAELDAKDNRSKIGVPAAPFIKTTDKWVSLAIKQVLATAVIEGYERVAFINGEQSAARYALGKHLQKLAAFKTGSGFQIMGTDLGGNTVDFGIHPVEKLASVIGAELAEKVAAQTTPNEVYRCAGNRIGGSGMMAFYDHIVPTAMKALLKKMGGTGLHSVKFAEKLEARERLGADYGLEELDSQLGFDITPAIAATVMAGMPLFSRSDNGAQAIYAPASDSIYLIADRIAPGHERAVFLHEVMHAKVPSLGGAEAVKRLAGQVSAWSHWPHNSLERQISERAIHRAEHALGISHEHCAEELMAYAVEEAILLGVQPSFEAVEYSAESWLADVTATIQGVIFQATRGAVIELNAQELVDLAYALAQLENPAYSDRILDNLALADTTGQSLTPPHERLIYA